MVRDCKTFYSINFFVKNRRKILRVRSSRSFEPVITFSVRKVQKTGFAKLISQTKNGAIRRVLIISRNFVKNIFRKKNVARFSLGCILNPGVPSSTRTPKKQLNSTLTFFIFVSYSKDDLPVCRRFHLCPRIWQVKEWAHSRYKLLKIH